MKVKSESEVAQSQPTLSNPMDCSPPGSSVHGIFQATALEWVASAFSDRTYECLSKSFYISFLILSSWQSADQSREVSPLLMCGESDRWLYSTETICLLYLTTELNYHFWSKTPNDVRMTYSSRQKKSPCKNWSNVIDLKEDGDAQHRMKHVFVRPPKTSFYPLKLHSS